MAGLVKWGSYDLDAAKREKEEIDKAGGGSAQFLKLKVGRNVLRVLPPKAGQSSPFVIVQQHFIRVPGKPAPAVFSCPRQVDERCPACEQAAKLRASGSKLDRDKAWDLMPKLRAFAAVIDRSAESKGPQVLGFGKTILEDLRNLREDEDAGGDYTHPVEGCDVIIERTGTGKFDTEYSVNLARRDGPITDDVDLMADWYEAIPDLTQFAAVPSWDELMEKLGVEGESGGGGDARKRRKRQTQKSFVDTDGEDTFGEDDIPY